MLKRENTYKRKYLNTNTKCRQTTNKAHKYRNRFKLGRPIPEGRKVLLENHSKGLLKSKKLRKLRSGPYTVKRMLTNTTYEIEHDKTSEKKTVHRNHIVPYYPKEEKLQELVENYVVADDTDDYYPQYNKHNRARSNAHRGAQHIAISQWPLVETQYNVNPSTTLRPTYNVEATPTKDSGLESLQTRVDNTTHIQGTSSSNFLPPRNSSPTLCKTCIHLIAHSKKIFLHHQIMLVNLKLHANYSPKQRIIAPHHHLIILHLQHHLIYLIYQTQMKY